MQLNIKHDQSGRLPVLVIRIIKLVHPGTTAENVLGCLEEDYLTQIELVGLKKATLSCWYQTLKTAAWLFWANLPRMIPLPWTVSLLLEWWPKMTLFSIARMRANELRPGPRGQLVVLRMRAPIQGQLHLRALGSDWLTFEEVVANEVYAAVFDRIYECRSIVDLGANIGLTTRYFATKFPRAEIVAVEPNPESFGILEINVESMMNVKVVNAALWSSETSLIGSSEPDNFGAFKVREDSSGKMRGVPIHTIMMMAGGAIDILKVDIEGAEVELFKGELGWLSQVRCIAIEFHGDTRNVSNFDQIMDQYHFNVIEGNHLVVAVRHKERDDLFLCDY